MEFKKYSLQPDVVKVVNDGGGEAKEADVLQE
jgi:hypothetical protein